MTSGDTVPAIVFNDKHSQGTRARITLGWGPPAPEALSELGRWQGAEANCWTWLDNEIPQVRCFNGGKAIAFCGHGLLACAWFWRQRGLAFTVVHSESASYCVSGDQAQPQLHCAPITCTAGGDIPRGWFNVPPVKSALAGDENGYRILCWPSGYDLASLQPNLSRIAMESTRSVIATAAAAPGGDHQVSLRYFAPNHGNPEDSVTGSACVVLTDFWRFQRLTLRQFSPRGGLVQTQRTPEAVILTGKVGIDACYTLL